MSITNDQNKILIVSESNNDVIKFICHWLLESNFKIVRLNAEIDEFSIVNMSPDHSSFTFKINNTEYDYKEFKTIYFHHGALQLKDITGVRSFLEDIIDFKSAFNYYRMAYEIALRETVSNLMHQEITIGKDQGGRINKLQMLNFAQKAGMQIPSTIVTTRKEDVFNFAKIHSKIISKSLDLNFFFSDKKRSKVVHGLICEILIEDIQEFPDDFPLTMFQENIVKVVELRIFFLGNKNYASAIFSQNSGNTIQDYRNYDDDFPNRVVPFRLPTDFEEKMNEFKRLSNLKTGSIDVIVDTENNYYFLEVNPQGQFMGVGEYCNYYLDKQVANFLTT